MTDERKRLTGFLGYDPYKFAEEHQIHWPEAGKNAPTEWHPGVPPHGDTGSRCLVAHVRDGVLQPSCVRCQCGEWVPWDEWDTHRTQVTSDDN